MEYKNIEVNEIIVRAKAGSNIGECIREAWALAIERWNNVILIHSDKEYKIFINKIYQIVEEKERDDE
jgi:hypothetical protein